MLAPHNLFAAIPSHLPEELVEVLLASEQVRIERIVSAGHASPLDFWYEQETREWVLLMQGSARLMFEGDAGPVEMRPGDFVDIPAHRRHRVEGTDRATPTIWLAIHVRDERCVSIPLQNHPQTAETTDV